MSMSLWPTIALVNLTATSHCSRRRPAVIHRRSGLELLFQCTIIRAAGLGRVPGKTPVGSYSVTCFGIITVEPWGFATGENVRIFRQQSSSRERQHPKPAEWKTFWVY
jgi:hypothetical protein